MFLVSHNLCFDSAALEEVSVSASYSLLQIKAVHELTEDDDDEAFEEDYLAVSAQLVRRLSVSCGHPLPIPTNQACLFVSIDRIRLRSSCSTLL